MAESRRPYISSSIEHLEGVFDAQRGNLSVISQIVHELSIRKTKRARLLLAIATKRLADFESEADKPAEAIASDGELASDEEDRDISEYENVGPAGDTNGSAVYLSKRPSDDTLDDDDQPPDDRKQPERLSSVRPNRTLGLPEPWVRPLHKDRPLGVAADADVLQIYAAALAALIAEIKTTGAGQKRYELENGIRSQGNESLYEFPFTDDSDLFEDAKVELEVSGRRLDGSIVSISSGRLLLATSEDLGRVLRRVIPRPVALRE